MIDLTFNNSYIKKYFETGNNPPIKEFLYLHTHPLVKPNFIQQLDDQMLSIGKYIRDRKMNPRAKIIVDLEKSAIIIGQELGNSPLQEENAKKILEEMRKSYQLGVSLGITV